MSSTHRPYTVDATIAAVASPPGEGAIAIVRISGREALSVARRIFSGPIHTYASHTAHHGRVVDEEGRTIDEVLLLVMHAPRTYTGEDTVEIFCHGGSLVTRRVLEAAIRAGAQAALPGEFSFKAFMNGKLDLAQAEAVQQLIAARSEGALRTAGDQLQGALSKRIITFQKQLVDVAATLEAWVDFPEEGLEFASLDELIDHLERVCGEMRELEASFHDGRRLREGLALCLVGRPNVGKSSLLNALLGVQRAIVTDIPGTTRDLIEEELRLGGLPIRLIDTAGIHETEEIVEKEGICRTMDAMQRADLVLLVLDASRPLRDEERVLLKSAGRPLVIWNKIDLAKPPLALEGAIPICAKSGEGLERLREAILQRVGQTAQRDLLITSLRHKEALGHAVLSCEQLISGLKEGVSPEFLTSDIRSVLTHLGCILGSDVTQEILSAIFSKFCVGK